MSRTKQLVTGEIEESELPKELPRRLCSEIQLFDLCELERCRFKDDKFCTDPEMLARFEAEAEPEDRAKWHFERGPDDEEDDEEQYSEEREEDDDGYSVFDDEDSREQDEDW